jgi:hypothetical protein
VKVAATLTTRTVALPTTITAPRAPFLRECETLLAAVRQPRPERFYEWCVEGMLFLPALALALA